MPTARKTSNAIGTVFRVLTLLCAGFIFPAAAQTPLDAGRIQRDFERNRVPALPPSPAAPPVVEEPVRPALAAPDTARFLVKGFRISGTRAYTETELLPLLQEWTGKELTLANLQRAADKLTRYYRDHGYFVARAYLPAQDIKDGIVEIVVLEGRIDRISSRATGEVRLRDSVIEGTLREAFRHDGLIWEPELERSLLLLSDMPGIEARATLAPGGEVGTSNLTAEISEGPLLSGIADIDNYGNKFTGTLRYSGALSLNDLTGYGDALSLAATGAEHSGYGRLGYRMPIGYSGFTVGAAYAASRYKLCCEFAALDAHGNAQVKTLSVSYPFVRSRDFTLRGSLSYENRHYFNATAVSTTSDKTSRAVSLSVFGDARDDSGGGGLSSFSLTVDGGHFGLGDWPADQAADAATTQTQGRYQKLGYTLARLQRLGESWAAYGALSGQFASKNLDSADKFVLGGPAGVRAYPQGEAAGDAGLLLNLELRYEWSAALRLAGFVDYGEITLHKNEWTNWNGGYTGLRNRYSLAGYGLSVRWDQPGDFFLQASLASRIGRNPGRDSSGNDVDAATQNPRLWMQAVKYF